MYRLTHEGEKYLKHGLPEMNLVLLLEKGKVTIEKAKQIENFSIAFQWAKKNGWIKISGNEIELAIKPREFPEQAALEKISKNKPVDDKIIDILLKRKLIEKEGIQKRSEEIEGKEITALTGDIIKNKLWKKIKLREYNVEVPGKKIYPGKRHPYDKFLWDVRQKLIQMGFEEMTGPTVELEFWNFDALFQAQDHPSRDWTETYSMKYPMSGRLPDKKIVDNVKSSHENGWKTGSTGWRYSWDEKKAARLVPRAHDTAISPRYLSGKIKIPGKYFSIVRCYRPDVIDATHGVEFNQMGGFVVADGLNFRDLLGLLKDFAFEIAGAEDVKFYSDYYPFTEPSVQVSVKHPALGWVELAGAGIFRPELTEPLGIKEPVIAWGFGIDRLAMYKLNITDIRYLFSQNLEWLRKIVI